ncbi:hypothetical protein N0725_04890 [Pseudomonas aeruginosa]|uniref:hypothetical protein n=1 Tax=Pseudomonas aeruginosa TaxID=287 RepID=UPI00044F6614|nr:hypothetical protein [Pseudomonas aeruginosa]ELK3486114.1 hypothetical protein [Pseudomonas aeruginosa]EME9747590.1 hypothetical protein [Pseudomonas aeruginosa]ETU74227.1 hypothetical protein Q095_04679 [Pseudomonas aeruginosa PS50]MBG4583281.1 hypothetical protein [Pseudomonas aeruginosa]MBH9070847.1 hypothetical protein [Pseudomonas aeruginosa]
MPGKHPDTCAFVFDSANSRVLEFRKTMLVNQVGRDAERIAKSFDALHAADLEKLSEQFAHCSAVLATGLVKIEQEEDDLRMACAGLLYNALNSMAAAAYILRGGFVLQPGPVIRSAIESMAMALHLMQFPQDLQKHREHQFDSTRAVSSAKRVFPPFGKFYGLLSREFTHVGSLHKQLTPIREYKGSEEPLDLNLKFLTSGIWMCYVSCELIFLDSVGAPRYWREIPVDVEGHTGYLFDPSAEEKAWMEDFLGLDNPYFSD